MDLPVRRKQNRFYGGLGAGMTGAWWQGLGKGRVEQRERERDGWNHGSICGGRNLVQSKLAEVYKGDPNEDSL